MIMLLMICCISLPAFALMAMVVGGTSPRRNAPELESAVSEQNAAAVSRFFAEEDSPRAALRPVPIEVVLSEIERHVRLEQAAVEKFIDVPTAESLHSRTTSPFVN